MSDELNLKEVSSVLFICMGNLCRSPTAEAVFRQKASTQGLNVKIDSAGTTGAHVREKPDHRAQKVGIERGYSFDGLKARKVTEKDFVDFDIVLAMDEDNIRELKKIAPADLHYKIALMLQFSENFDEKEVPDPYYGGAKGFKYVLDLVEDASDGLIKALS